MGMWDSTDRAAAAAGPGSVPLFQSSSSDTATTDGWCCETKVRYNS